MRNFLSTDKPEHHSIDRLKERGVEKGSGRHSTLQGRERSVFNQTNIGTVSRATLGRLLRDGAECVWAFPSATMPSLAETETEAETETGVQPEAQALVTRATTDPVWCSFWLTFYAVTLGQCRLAEPISLQARPQPKSSNSEARPCLGHLIEGDFNLAGGLIVEAHSTAMQCQHRHETGCTGLHGTSSREFPDLTAII